MQMIDYEELAKREVIKEIKRFRKRFVLEMDLLSGEEKRRIVEEIDKIIEQIKEDKFYKRKAEQLQWRLDAYERLQDCDEEFEL